MKVLKDLLYGVSIKSVRGNTGVEINNLCFDSRSVGSEDVFIAVPGTVSDGHDYIGKATDSGARVVICEVLPAKLADDIVYVEVDNAHRALALMAGNYYENPSQNLKLVGVTGTNGKTTVTTLLYELFKRAGYKVGLISTIRILVNEVEYPTRHTTPDSLTINRFLAEMSEAGVEFCFMEVSSHGLAQNRTTGLNFAGGVFTNLTHDHLDYHKDFATYRNVKKMLFDGLGSKAFALVNADDKNGMFMLQNTRAKKYGYALKTYSDFMAQILEQQADGQLLKIRESEVWTKLLGVFNAYNILAIYGVAILLGLESLEVLKWLSDLKAVSGRFQSYVSKAGIKAIVDYAHTPDALRNVLDTIQTIRTGNEQVITVVGCGGDRDQAKRPVMGKIAAALSQTVIFTSDNPRTESPEFIIESMKRGVEPQHERKVLSIPDREQAIRTACKMAAEGDIILIAGKGHETYQEIAGIRKEFDDFQIVTNTLDSLG